MGHKGANGVTAWVAQDLVFKLVDHLVPHANEDVIPYIGSRDYAKSIFWDIAF